MSRFSRTGLAVQTHGAFTRLDHSIMSQRELAERKEFVQAQIAEYEAELASLDAHIIPAPTVENPRGGEE